MPLIRPGIRRLFKLTLREPDTRPYEVDEEIALHLELRAQQLRSTGLSPEHAHAEALRRFGPAIISRGQLRSAAKRRDRIVNMREQLASVAQDVRYAARGLVRERWFTAFVAITLGLGIGVNAAMYGVVKRLLLSGPEHIRDVSHVRRLLVTSQPPGMDLHTTGYFIFPTYDALRKNTPSVQMAAYKIFQDATTFGSGLNAARWSTGEATANLFPLLGVTPLLGRFFSDEEDKLPAARVVVLGYRVWQHALNGDSAIVGKSIELDGDRYTVIGVARKGFTGPDLAPVDAWLVMKGRAYTVTNIVARLAPGTTLAHANLEVAAAFRNASPGAPAYQLASTLTFAPLAYGDDGVEPAEARVSRWLIGVSAVVLIVACSNVANLLLARAVRRRREIAVRLALGVSRTRLLRLFLVESLMLATIGAAAGLGVAYAMGAFMRLALPAAIEWTSSPVDASVLTVSTLLAVTVGFFTGLLPAWRASRPNLTVSLKSGNREGGGHQSRMRTTLTVAQAALSVTLLIGAGLFIRSLSRAHAQDLGIQPDRVLVVNISWRPLPRVASKDERALESRRRRAIYPLLLTRMRQMADVEHASLAVGGLPFLQISFGGRLRVPGWDSLPNFKGGQPGMSAISNDYFQTLGTPMLSGRAFNEADRSGSESVAIVNETMARTLWPNSNAVGSCLYSGDDSLVPCSRIVGIVADAHRSTLQPDVSMNYYVPIGQETGLVNSTFLLVRPRGTVSAFAAKARAAVQELDPTISYISAKPLADALEREIRPWRLGAQMFALMGLLALCVAAIGLYSVMSYLVVQRRHEMGVRLALGASGADILSLIVRTGVGNAVAGVALGIVGALIGGRFLEPLLFQTSPTDVVVFGVVALSLIIVATLSCLIPAWRAKRIHPLDALRTE